MKFTLKNATLVSMMAIAASVSFTACDDDEKNDNNNNSTWTAQDLAISAAGILENYVDNVVVATYGDLKDDAKLLLDAAEALSTEPNATNMANVDKYWKYISSGFKFI